MAAVTPAGSVANLRAADVSADVTMEDVRCRLEVMDDDKWLIMVVVGWLVGDNCQQLEVIDNDGVGLC